MTQPGIFVSECSGAFGGGSFRLIDPGREVFAGSQIGLVVACCATIAYHEVIPPATTWPQ